MARRVVITGIGPVTAIGIGKEQFFQNLLHHQVSIKEIPSDYERNYRFKSRHFVPVPEVSFIDFGIDPALRTAMEKIAKLSVIATKLALIDAGLDIVANGRYFGVNHLAEAAVVIGVGMSSLQTAFKSYLAHLFGNDSTLREHYSLDFRYNRMVIPMLMPNSVAAWNSILFGITGPSLTVNAACASGTCAVGEAFRKIANGEVESAITGGAECLQEQHGAIMRGFDMLTTLTRSADGQPMPFSQNRSGFLFNEGAACTLILEELNRARQRGAKIYAEICDYQANNDAANIVQMEESGRAITAILSKIAGDKKIDYLNTHGTATLANDQIEAAVIKTFFGNPDSQPHLNSTKGILGHSIGASGAIEAAVTALSIDRGIIHGNQINDPIADLNLTPETTTFPVDYAISTSYGFGGHNAALLLKRYTADE
jgi:3-oxoacyl-[acyl-carrier-protein] synthase II